MRARMLRVKDLHKFVWSIAYPERLVVLVCCVVCYVFWFAVVVV